MAGLKVNAVIEAVRYSPQGRIELVRLYERRGATFSDSFLAGREELLRRLQRGQVIATGRRLAYQGSSFDIGTRVHQHSGQVTTGEDGTSRDLLENVPLF
jgi:hypothetical protein